MFRHYTSISENILIFLAVSGQQSAISKIASTARSYKNSDHPSAIYYS